VQLICHCLVTQFNRLNFEMASQSLAMTDSPRARRFNLDDVEAVINTPEFFRDGNAYFTGVWKQAETGEIRGQQPILQTLARSEMGMSIGELAQKSGLTLADVQKAREVLQRHDVVTTTGDSWQFTVELMRRWVRNYKDFT
jgi:hypothetical protein